MKLSLEELQIIYEVFNQYMEDWIDEMIDEMDESILENKQFLKYNEIYKKLAKSLYLRRRRKNHERTNSR